MNTEIQKPERNQIKAPKNTSRIRSELFKRIDFAEETVGFHGGSKKRTGTRLALWTWLSASVDALVMIGMSCFFILAFSFLMKTSMAYLIKYFYHNLNLIKLSTYSFCFSFCSYLVFMRVFNGATLGEWTCSLRLGQPVQRMQSNYILKVSLRTFLIVITGIIVLPILSLILKKDLAGEISGVKMYSLV